MDAGFTPVSAPAIHDAIVEAGSYIGLYRLT